MDIYREQLLEHYHHPRGWGLAGTADAAAAGYNPLCGDAVKVQLDLQGNSIKAMRFEGHGCVISRAAASLLNTHLVGKTVEQVLAQGRGEVEMLLGINLPPARVKCGLLTLETVQLACRQALDKRVSENPSPLTGRGQGSSTSSSGSRGEGYFEPNSPSSQPLLLREKG